MSQFTTYCNLHFLLLSAPCCKGSRGINKKSRKNRTAICIYNIHPCCCRATGAGAVPGTTEVFAALCANSPLAGARNSIRMYPNPVPWARTVCETQEPPSKGISSALTDCRHSPGSRGQGGSLPQPSRGRSCRGDRTTSVPCQAFSAPCASSSCVFYPSFCWHTWSRTTASLLGVPP